MLVKNWMSKEVIIIEDEASMMDASQLMREKNVNRLPVVSSSGNLVGIVSDRDIKAASPSKATTLDVHELYYLLSKIKVREVMTQRPYTISPDDTVEKAAVIMLEKKITGLPVIDDSNAIVGILTQGDVFRVLTSITGVYRGGITLAFELDDRAGSIKEVADVIRAAGGSMTSILTSYDTAPEGMRNVFFRVQGLPEDKLESFLQEVKTNFRYLYHVRDDLKAQRA